MNWQRVTRFLGVLAAGLIWQSAGFAQPILFPNFSSTAGLTLNSSSTTTNSVSSDGTILRLVGTTTASQAGSAFTNSTVKVTTGFSTSFNFRLTSRGGSSDGIAAGADGLVFVLQRQGPTALGGTGELLGYGGIGSSVGVEFDTFKNSNRGDPSSNHLGVNTGGSVESLVTANVAPDFDSSAANGPKWTAWVDYNGTVLEVRVSNDGIRPTSALLSQSINLATTLGGDSAYLGFTAATGGAEANHDLLTWAFSNAYAATGVTLFQWSGTGSWTNTAKWNPAVVPGAADVAYVASGTATVSSNSTLGLLNFSGGTLDGTGALTLAQSGSTWSGGDLSGLTLNANGSLAISTSSAKRILGSAHLNLSDATTWSEGTIQTGSGAEITNTGAFTTSFDGTVTSDPSGTRGTFRNQGSFTKT